MIGLAWLSAAAMAASAEPLTLEAAVAEAMVKTRGVIHAKADLLLADVEKMRALSPILPKLDLQVSVTENFGGLTGVGSTPFVTQTSNDPVYSLQLIGKQLIYDGGRWWTVIGRANDNEREKRAALAVIENATRLEVARRFWELAKGERGVLTLSEQVAIDLAQVDRAKAMLEAGVSKLSDVAQAERNLATDRITLAQREEAVRAAKRTLNLAIGRPSSTEFELAVSENPIPTAALPNRESLVTTALASRPDLVRTRATLDVLEKNVGIARADYFPQVGLQATYGKQSTELDNVFGDPTENYGANVSLGVTWNLFNGRAHLAAVESAELELSKLHATFDEEQRIAASEVEDRLDLLALSMRVHELSLDSIRSGEEAVRLARGLFAEGRGTSLELRDAEQQLTRLKLSEIEARMDLEIAREELRRAVGGELSWP